MNYRTRRKKYVLHHRKSSYKKKYLTRRRKGGKFNWFRAEKQKEIELIKPQPLDRLSYGVNEDDAKITYIPKYLPIINDESSKNYISLQEIIQHYNLKKNPSSHCEKDIKLDVKFNNSSKLFQKAYLRAKIFPIQKKKERVTFSNARYEHYFEPNPYDDVYLNKFKNADEKVWCEFDFPEENKWKVTSRLDEFHIFPGNFFNSYNPIINAQRDLINTITYSLDDTAIFEIKCTRSVVNGEYDFYEIKFDIKLL